MDYFYDMEYEAKTFRSSKYTRDSFKHIQYNLTWEKMKVNFMVFHKDDDVYDEILFTCEKIKVHQKRMEPMQRTHEWMLPKYGTNVRPWAISVEFPNTESDEGQFRGGVDSNLKYTYSLRNSRTGDIISERDLRWIDLLNPNEYNGSLGKVGSCLWLNTDQVWLVNGSVFKADGNFLNHFFFNRIGDTPISLGSYPFAHGDYQRIKSHGSTAILNIMDQVDLRQHQLEQSDMSRLAGNCGITKYYNSPVWDS